MPSGVSAHTSADVADRGGGCPPPAEIPRGFCGVSQHHSRRHNESRQTTTHMEPTIQPSVWATRFSRMVARVQIFFGNNQSGLPGLGTPVGRIEIRSMILTSQLPVAKWHEQIGDPTLADSILDRLVHNAHRIEMRGESMRKKRDKER